LSPTADDAAVPPHRRAGVARAVEQGGPVFAQVPIASRPAHYGWIKPWQEGGERSGPARRLEGARQHDPGDPAEVDLDWLDRGQRTPDLGQRPPGPPAHVLNRGRPERFEPQPHQLRLRFVDGPIT